MELSNVSCCPLIEDPTLSFLCSTVRSNHAEWTSEEDKLFEEALALHDLNSCDLFEKIAIKIPGKSIEQIKEHFELLVEDVKLIETFCGPLPDYKTSFRKDHESTSNRLKSSVDHQLKRKGTRWTKEEHENFLLGLKRYGKGDWRSISRNSVMTKTPTQVASHAQKYFIRLAKLSTTTNPLKFSSSQATAKIRTTPYHSSGAGSSYNFHQPTTTVTSNTEKF